MNKKGYTIIEILISIFLLIIICVSITIGLRSNRNKLKEKQKLVDEIIASADVYNSINSDFKKKIEENGGCLVLTIKELKEMGMLNTNQILPELNQFEIDNNKSYEKMVICEDVIDDNVLGLYNYIYPYEPNLPNFKKISDLTLEFEDAKNFKCNYSNYNIEEQKTETLKLDYIDEKYDRKLIDSYTCSLDGSIIENEYNLKNKISDKTIENNFNVQYFLEENNEISKDRNVKVLPEINLNDYNIYINDENKCNTNKTNWIGEDGFIGWNNPNSNIEHNFKYKWKYNNIEKTDEKNDSLSITTDNSGLYTSKITLLSRITNNEIISKEQSCEIKVDDKVPDIIVTNLDNNGAKIKFVDTESGLDKYCITNDDSCEPNQNVLCNDQVCFEKEINNEINFQSNDKYYIKVKDKVGNEKTLSLDKNNIPTINVTPIANSLFKFQIDIYAGNDNLINNVDIQYTFDNIYYNGYKTIQECGDYVLCEMNNNLIRYYSYDKDYKTSNLNYINDDIVPSNSTYYSYEINMFDQLSNCYGCLRLLPDLLYASGVPINYYVKITTNKGTFERKYQINYNVNKYELAQESDYHKEPTFYLNESGNILLKQTRWDPYKAYEYYDYFYRNKNKYIKKNIHITSPDNYNGKTTTAKNSLISEFNNKNIIISECHHLSHEYWDWIYKKYLTYNTLLYKTINYDTKNNDKKNSYNNTDKRASYECPISEISIPKKVGTYNFIDNSDLKIIELNKLITLQNNLEEQNKRNNKSVYNLSPLLYNVIISHKNSEDLYILIREYSYAMHVYYYYLLGFKPGVSIIEQNLS